jgi:DNA-binding transcriptional ArsR family regulator
MDRSESALVEMTDVRWLAFAAEGFAALAQVDRVRLVLALGDDELSVNHLADIVALSPLAVRQHLAVLAFHGFVSSQRYGDRLFYRVSNPLVSRLVLSKLPIPVDIRFGRPCRDPKGEGQG